MSDNIEIRLIDQINKKLDKLKDYTAEKLIRKDTLGAELNFSNGEKSIVFLLDLLDRTRKLQIIIFPFIVLTKINTYLDAITNLFDSIIKFSPAQTASARSVRDDILSKLYDNADKFFSAMMPYLAFSSISDTAQASMHKHMRDMFGEMQNYRADAYKVLEDIKAASVKAVVGKHTIFFQQEANKHQSNSRKWLRATVLIALLTAGFALYFLIFLANLDGSGSNIKIIQISISKIAIFLVLYFALYWCGKNYKTQQHNFVVNKHRHNALSTYQVLVDALKDDQIKNAILIQATSAIFAPQPSGFISNEPESSPASILDVLGKALGSKNP